MRRMPLLVVLLVGFTLIAGLACDGGNGGADSPTPEGTTTPEGSPTANVSPEATEVSRPTPLPSVTVTPPAGVRLAILPRNYYDFLLGLGGSQQNYRLCGYDESSGLVDCTNLDLGQIQLDPPMSGSGVQCSALAREGKLLAVQCISKEPNQATLYEVLE